MTTTSTSLEMSAVAASAAPTARPSLDDAVGALAGRAREFARLAPAAKAQLLRECVQGLYEVAPAWVADGARARGAAPAEEWLAGVIPTIRMFRLLARSLDQIAATAKPVLGRGVRRRSDGRIEIALFPASAIDGVLYQRFTGHALMDEGVDEREARRRQAVFYARSDPDGGVALILGAGNVASIPPMDVATKMFIEGYVCILKLSPVNEWLGPHLERALAPLIGRGYLRIVQGGAEVGQYLTYHPGIDDVHITGSDRTHDLIVWGPAGPERDRRMAANEPLLKVPMSSELGNVSPVAIVPYTYTDAELWFQARNVVTMVVNNGSFNCNAAKMLITAKGWAQREKFLDLVAKGLASAPTRNAYYPGAVDRYTTLLAGKDDVARFGAPAAGKLQWAFVRGLEAEDRGEPLFRTEPFCGILSETAVASTDPVAFLDAATSFMNERLWGTLNAMLVIHPKLERDPVVAKALDQALVGLRYGTVGINHWPALGYVLGTLPWGGHPSATRHNIQSGLGWVHNTFMLDGIDKVVLRGPLTTMPYPLWFFDNRHAARALPAVAAMEAAPSWAKLPGLFAKVLI